MVNIIMWFSDDVLVFFFECYLVMLIMLWVDNLLYVVVVGFIFDFKIYIVWVIIIGGF